MLRASPTAFAALTALCVNFTALSVCIHISRTRLQPDEPRYKASSAVVLTEVGKLIVSVILALREIEAAHTLRPSPHLGQHDSHVDVDHSPAMYGLGLDTPLSKRRPDDRVLMLRDDEDSESTMTSDAEESFSTSTWRRPVALRFEPKRSIPAISAEIYDDKQGCVSPTAVQFDTHWSDVLPVPFVEPVDELSRLYDEVFAGDYWKVALPAALFAGQGCLMYTAVGNLSVPAFQVLSQLKILTTALCSVAMLNRRLSAQQWAALCLLAFGVASVQLSTSSGNKAAKKDDMNPMLGFSAVVASCLSSGFASIYFEKQLKSASRDRTAQPGLWVRNVQLSIFALTFALAMNLIETWKDPVASWLAGDSINGRRQPWSPAQSIATFFVGFDALVWLVVALQVAGGLLAALVMKHADNIAKNFSTSLSILLGFAASVLLFDFSLTLGAIVGSILVVAATFAYAAAPTRANPVIDVLSPQSARKSPLMVTPKAH